MKDTNVFWEAHKITNKLNWIISKTAYVPQLSAMPQIYTATVHSFKKHLKTQQHKNKSGR